MRLRAIGSSFRHSHGVNCVLYRRRHEARHDANRVASRRAFRLWQINVKTPKRHFNNAAARMAVDGARAAAIGTNHDMGR
ncbi:hypothetical protein BLAT2472_11084 [Burkholderia latens]